MLNKIYKEIDDFTKTIKGIDGCDKMLTYINSNVYASIKLLMFASKSFSLYGKIMLFFIISLTGLLLMSSLGAAGLNMGLLAITLVLYVFILSFTMHCKNYIISSINKIKIDIQEDKN